MKRPQPEGRGRPASKAKARHMTRARVDKRPLIVRLVCHPAAAFRLGLQLPEEALGVGLAFPRVDEAVIGAGIGAGEEAHGVLVRHSGRFQHSRTPLKDWLARKGLVVYKHVVAFTERHVSFSFGVIVKDRRNRAGADVMIISQLRGKSIARFSASAMFAVTLAGCGTVPTPEPITKTVEVKVAVPIACVPDTLKRETFTDTDQALKAAPDFSIRYQLLSSEHARHFAFEDELWGVIAACQKVPAPK